MQSPTTMAQAENTTDSTEHADTEQESIAQYAERISLQVTVPTGILIGLFIFLANWGRNPVPMLGDWRAFGTLALYMLVVVTVIVGSGAYYLGAQEWNKRVSEHGQRPVRWPAVPIGLAYTVVVAFAAVLMLLLVDFAFALLALAKLQAAFIAGAIGAAMLQWVVKDAIQMTLNKLVTLTFAVIGIGVYLTAATIDDPLWWQISFSYLGTMKSSSRTIFNIALSFTGLLIVIWMPFFLNSLRILVRHGMAVERSIRVYQIAFVWLGIGIAFVGIFKSGYTPFTSLMHNLSAYSLAGVFAVLMLGLKWLIPTIPREVLAMSWALMVALVVTLILAAFGYFNTVGLEIVIFVLGLTWLSSFINSVSSLAQEAEPEAFTR